MRNLLEKNCSAIVISNHIMAIDSIKYLSMQNIEVNEDLTIVAFDDYGWNSLMSNSFDNIIQPVQDFGKIVGDTMLDRLLHPQAPNKQLILYSIYQQKIQINIAKPLPQTISLILRGIYQIFTPKFCSFYRKLYAAVTANSSSLY